MSHRPVCRFTIILNCAWIFGGSYLAGWSQMPQLAWAGPPLPTREDADSYYQPHQIQVIHLRVRKQDLDRMNAALPERIYVPATYQWGPVTNKNVGVRYKGNSSSIPGQQHKRGFLIKFNEFQQGQTFLGLQRVALDNGVQFGSLFSEPLITSILRDLGVVAPRCNFAKLYMNGDDAGVYVNVERIDKTFVRTHFTDGRGALYKVDEGGAGADWTPLPPHPHPTERIELAFEPKSKIARQDARDVRELMARVHQTPADEFARVMEATGEAACIVQRAVGEASEEFGNHMGRPGADVTDATDDRVLPGQTYRYRVYAIRPTPAGPQGTGVSNTIVVRVPED